MSDDLDLYHDPMDMLHEATQYLERVRQTLLEAERFEDILPVRDASELYRQYARQRRYGIDIQNIGAEIKLRAERRAGELLSEMPKNSGQLFRGDMMIPREAAPTYSELGINKQQAVRWQRASALPEDLFEQYLAETKDRHYPITSAAVIRLANTLRTPMPPEPPIDLQYTGCDITGLLALIDTGVTFGTIYVDPPYGELSRYELAELPVLALAAEQAHLHLWAPTTFLFDAKALLDAWGFVYQSSFVWVNPHPSEGPFWRDSHTSLLLGVRDAAPFRETMRSWVEYPATPGGGKPEVVREMIERVSPAPYLDLLGRQAVANWMVWHPDIGCVAGEDYRRAMPPMPRETSPIGQALVSEAASGPPTAQPQASPDTVSQPDALTLSGASDVQLPPEMSYTKEMLRSGVAYVFRHQEMGLLGRIVVQELSGRQSMVSLEIAGDAEDPMTERRMAVFEPVAKELVRRLELQSGYIENVLGLAPPVPPGDAGELVESKLIPCETCGAGVALLIFAPGATDLGRFEDYARRMYKHVEEMDVPTYLIGPELGGGPMQERPADTLKIWPEREPMQRLRPDEFNPLLEALDRAHCGPGTARHELELMHASGELTYRGTRRHRGSLCPKCFFYRLVSEGEEACDSYEKWLIDPPVKRETCDHFISR